MTGSLSSLAAMNSGVAYEKQLWRRRVRALEDFILDDTPVQSVRAELQRHLRHLQPQVHPVGRDVIEVVEADRLTARVRRASKPIGCVCTGMSFFTG